MSLIFREVENRLSNEDYDSRRRRRRSRGEVLHNLTVKGQLAPENSKQKR